MLGYSLVSKFVNSSIRQFSYSHIPTLLDFIWPRTCEACGRPVDRPGRHVCSDCLNRLPFAPTDGCCRKCGRAADKLNGEFLCEDCRANQPSFDRVASALYFDLDARTMLNDFKFKNHYWLRNDFADWLEGVARARFKVDEVDLVLPMPSTLVHRMDRGFNPCDYLGRVLAKRLKKPYVARALERVDVRRRQRGLSEEDRRTNVVGTFHVRKPAAVHEKTVLVVDDILTTGSTLSECAAELKLAGAARVWCVTLARTPRN